MSRTTTVVSIATLLAAVALNIAGCGPIGSSSGSANTGGGGPATASADGSGSGSAIATSQPGTAVAVGAPASNADGSNGGSGSQISGTSCSHGLQPGANGVVDVECDGPATIHITAGSVSESITGGTCRQAGTTWTVTAGVITQYGIYDGPPVDVISVAATVGKDASIQAELSGKMLLVDSASFTLSADAKSAHLAGTSNRNADIANTSTTVDVAC
jgi:hypothetical protein